MAIRTLGSTPNPRLPIYNPGAYIAGRSSLVFWGTAEASLLSLSGSDIESWSNRKSGGTGSFVKQTLAAVLDANEVNGWAIADATPNQRYAASSITFDTSLPHWMMLMGRLPLQLAQNGILGRFNSSTVRNQIYRLANSTVLDYRRGESRVGVPYAYDEPFCYFCSFDGTLMRAQINRNVAEPVTAVGTGGTATLALAASTGTGSGASNVDILEFAFGYGDIIADAAMAKLKASFQTLARELYGIPALPVS